jgi:hypothetical protein
VYSIAVFAIEAKLINYDIATKNINRYDKPRKNEKYHFASSIKNSKHEKFHLQQ